MSRRRSVRCWHIGDRVQIPWIRAHGYLGHPAMEIGGWTEGTVVGSRGDRVIVDCRGWIRDYPCWQIRPAREHHGVWRRWWSHDKSRQRLAR